MGKAKKAEKNSEKSSGESWQKKTQANRWQEFDRARLDGVTQKLEKLSGTIAAGVKTMDQLGIESVLVDGATKASAAIGLLEVFAANLEAAISKEKIARL